MKKWYIQDITKLQEFQMDKKSLYILSNKINGVVTKILKVIQTNI